MRCKRVRVSETDDERKAGRIKVWYVATLSG